MILRFFLRSFCDNDFCSTSVLLVFFAFKTSVLPFVTSGTFVSVFTELSLFVFWLCSYWAVG